MGKLRLIGDNYYFLAEKSDEMLLAKFKWCKEKNSFMVSDWAEAMKLKQFAMDDVTKESIEFYERNLYGSSADDYMEEGSVFSGMYTDLFKYQRIGVYEMKRRLLQYQCALLADEQGLGKTIQVAKIIEQLFELQKINSEHKVLIVCPSTLKLNWKKELEKWCNNDAKKIQVINSSKDWLLSYANITIVNYDLLTKSHILGQLLDIQHYLVIADEAHYLKNYKALRTKAAYKLFKTINYKIMLTGTPVLNRPIELFSIIKCMGATKVLGAYDTYLKYAYRYCNGYWDNFGVNVSGHSNLEELNFRLRSTIMIRREKEDVLWQLPQKTYQIIPLDHNKRTRSIFKQIELLDIIELKKKPELGNVGEISKLRNELAMSKIDESIAYIKLLLESKEKIVVFAYHKNIIEKLKESFEYYGAVVVSGAETSQEKFNAVEAFQNDESIRVFIGQIKSAGVGITLTASDTVVFVETSWVPGEVEQAIDRCHRIGQTQVVSAQFLVVENSIDEFMLQSIIKKKNIINTIVK